MLRKNTERLFWLFFAIIVIGLLALCLEGCSPEGVWDGDIDEWIADGWVRIDSEIYEKVTDHLVCYRIINGIVARTTCETRFITLDDCP